MTPRLSLLRELRLLNVEFASVLISTLPLIYRLTMFFYLSSYISGPKVHVQDPHMFFLLVGAPRRVYRAPTDYFLLVGAPRHVYRAPNYPSIGSFPQGATPPPVHLLTA